LLPMREVCIPKGAGEGELLSRAYTLEEGLS